MMGSDGIILFSLIGVSLGSVGLVLWVSSALDEIYNVRKDCSTFDDHEGWVWE